MFVQKHTQLTSILETGVKTYAENWLQFQSELHEIKLTLMIYLRENILKVETVKIGFSSSTLSLNTNSSEKTHKTLDSEQNMKSEVFY